MLRHDRLGMSALIVTALAVGTAPSVLMAAEITKPASVEAIPDSELKRVILTPQTAEQLGIEMGAVREEPVKRWLLVDGEVEAVPKEPVVPPAADAAVTTSDVVPVRVRVPRLNDPDVFAPQTIVVLSLGEDDDDDESEKDDDKNDDDTDDGSKILVLTIDGSSNAANVRAAPLDEAFAAPAQYYEVSNTDHRLTPGQRVQLKLVQPDSGKPQKVIPYSAVIYDLQGGIWAYGNPEPLVFVRQAITIEYIQKDLAVLKEGPPTGTAIVSVGAAELMGIEQRIGN